MGAGVLPRPFISTSRKHAHRPGGRDDHVVAPDVRSKPEFIASGQLPGIPAARGHGCRPTARRARIGADPKRASGLPLRRAVQQASNHFRSVGRIAQGTPAGDSFPIPYIRGPWKKNWLPRGSFIRHHTNCVLSKERNDFPGFNPNSVVTESPLGRQPRVRALSFLRRAMWVVPCTAQSSRHATVWPNPRHFPICSWIQGIGWRRRRPLPGQPFSTKQGSTARRSRQPVFTPRFIRPKPHQNRPAHPGYRFDPTSSDGDEVARQAPALGSDLRTLCSPSAQCLDGARPSAG